MLDMTLASMLTGLMSVGLGAPVDLVKIRLQMQTLPCLAGISFTITTLQTILKGISFSTTILQTILAGTVPIVPMGLDSSF